MKNGIITKSWHNHIEDKAAGLVFLILAILPTIEIFARLIFNTGLKGSEAYIRNAVVWVAFLAGTISSREKGHLSLTSGNDLIKGRIGRLLHGFVTILCTGICLGLAVSSLSFLLIGFDPEQTIGFIPVRVVMIIMPVGFAVMALRFLFRVGEVMPSIPLVGGSLLAGLFLGIPALGNMAYTLMPEPPLFIDTLTGLYYSFFSYAALPLILIMILSAFIGTPIFLLLGGIAYFLFSRDWGSLEVLTNEA
jgi:TRAP-type C4-dicarboxylate transport system permease small subunit